MFGYRRLAALFLWSIAVLFVQSTPAMAQPNIIHIFADDLGKGSIGFLHQNARAAAGLPAIKTPNLDALAAAGMNFEKAYAATLCSPSRGMLYMGFNQAHNANDRNTVAPRAQDVTLAEVLKQANYTTSVYGKWGFGGSSGDLSGPKEDSLGLGAMVSNTDAVPTTHGYDEFTGYLNHSRAHRYFVDYLWTTDDTGNSQTAGISQLPLGNDDGNGNNLHATYTHDVVAARSEQFIEDHYQGSDPFFMQVNYTIPHNDLEAIQFLPGWFDAYNGVDTSSWTNKEKFYAAMITRMDQSIGSLMAKLEDPDGDPNTDDSIMDNTMIVFTSDNGATDADFSREGLEHFGLITDPGDPNNGGYLRGGKRDLWEGGIQMPQFVRWDGVVTPGSSTDHQTDLTDFMATVADLAGVQAPVGIDGHSLAPLLTGTGIQRQRDYLVFEHHEGDGPDTNGLNPRWAIIRGDYKLIEFSSGAQLLYNLATDPDENAPLDQGVPANASLVAELTSIALADGVEQPASYDHQYAEWTGVSGDDLSQAASWNLSATPHPTWSTVVNNTTGSDSVVESSDDVDTLGFEVQGDNGNQTVRAGRKTTLTGRNAVRIDNGGRINLDDATLESWRWTDVLAGGQLTGHGSVKGDVYNQGTISPGLPSDLPVPPNSPPPVPFVPPTWPQGVDTGVVPAIVFDFTGIQDDAPLTQTSTLNQYLEIDHGLDFGPGIGPRNSADEGNEFNITGFPGNNTGLADAIAGNDYLTFTVDPVYGIEMLVDTVTFQLRRNGSGAAQEYAILTSLDGFNSSAAIGTIDLTAGDTNTYNLTGTYSGGEWTVNPVEVRMYGWDQEGGNGNTHIYNVDMTASFRTSLGVPEEALKFDFSGVQDVAPLTATSTLDTNLNIVSGLDWGSGVRPRSENPNGTSSTDEGDEFNLRGFQGTSLADAITQEDYLGFAVAPVAGIEMLLDAVAFNVWRNESGGASNAATDYAVLTSLDGFTSGAEIGTQQFDGLTEFGSDDQKQVAGIYSGGQWTTDTVEVRVYGWNAGGEGANTHFNEVAMSAFFRSVFEPDASLDPTGTLTLNGDFWHIAGGLINLDLGGSDNSDPLDPQYDSIVVSGNFEIEGDLILSLSDGFQPSLDDTFDIFDFGSLSGSFNLLQLPSLNPGLDWDTTNLLVDGTITVVASPDFNGDGQVDGFDFLAWQRGESPTPFSQSDLLLWQDNFGSSNSQTPSSSTVPEPTAMLLLSIGAVLFCSTRCRTPGDVPLRLGTVKLNSF